MFPSSRVTVWPHRQLVGVPMVWPGGSGGPRGRNSKQSARRRAWHGAQRGFWSPKHRRCVSVKGMTSSAGPVSGHGPVGAPASCEAPASKSFLHQRDQRRQHLERRFLHRGLPATRRLCEVKRPHRRSHHHRHRGHCSFHCPLLPHRAKNGLHPSEALSFPHLASLRNPECRNRCTLPPSERRGFACGSLSTFRSGV